MHDLPMSSFFGAILAATQGHKPSVVQIRADDLSPEAIGGRVVAALWLLAPELDEGALVTVDANRTRVRVLPLLRRVAWIGSTRGRGRAGAGRIQVIGILPPLPIPRASPCVRERYDPHDVLLLPVHDAIWKATKENQLYSSTMRRASDFIDRVLDVSVKSRANLGCRRSVEVHSRFEFVVGDR